MVFSDVVEIFEVPPEPRYLMTAAHGLYTTRFSREVAKVAKEIIANIKPSRLRVRSRPRREIVVKVGESKRS
jgi:hypothetical protein